MIDIEKKKRFNVRGITKWKPSNQSHQNKKENKNKDKEAKHVN